MGRSVTQKAKREQQVQEERAKTGRVISQDRLEERAAKVVPLQAKSEAQKKALNAFTEKQLVILSGSAGSGKSELMCWWASKLWLENKIENIVICRPHQSLGNDYGAVTGNDTQKLLPFCMSMMMKFKKYLGYGILKNNFRMDVTEGLFQEAAGISIVPIEKIQGLSFNHKTIILADELQNATSAQIKALVTRSEEGCQLICAGDNLQSALSGKNGLYTLEKALELHPHEDAEIIKFTPQDNCRSGISGHLANIFESQGKWDQ
jgi:phosphate starvation-inducible PhoH-like protein